MGQRLTVHLLNKGDLNLLGHVRAANMRKTLATFSGAAMDHLTDISC